MAYQARRSFARTATVALLSLALSWQPAVPTWADESESMPTAQEEGSEVEQELSPQGEVAAAEGGDEDEPSEAPDTVPEDEAEAPEETSELTHQGDAIRDRTHFDDGGVELAPQATDEELEATAGVSCASALNADNLMTLLATYDQDAAWIIYNAEGLDGSSWQWWLSGCSTIGDAEGQYGTAVHEQLHAITLSEWDPLLYYIGNGTVVPCRETSVFDTLECTKSMPASLRTFRYDTYVGPDAEVNMHSRKGGPYGLLDEYAAYLWGMTCDMRLEAFFGMPSYGSNDYVAFQEFRHYILRYMIYARDHHPDVYDEVMHNVEFLRAFKVVDDKFEDLAETYRKTHRLFDEYEQEYAALAAASSTPEYKAMLAQLKSFPDVAYNHWASKVVQRAAKLGLVSGYDNGCFGPEDNITRGQAAVILWRMAGSPKTGSRSFPDVKSDAYYYQAVRWAGSLGVVNGHADGTFRPADKVTREQLAVMLANYARRVGKKTVVGSASDYANMKDASKVADYAQQAVGWCFRNKILSGSQGNVLPKGNATRAQAAKMLVGLYDLLR